MIVNILKNTQNQIVIFLLSIIIATTIIIISHSVLETAIENKNTHNNSLNSVKQKYYTAIDRKLLLEKFNSRYTALINQNIAGTEDRLNWIDAIESIVSTNNIPYMKYKIGKQIKLKSNNLNSKYPDIDVLKSTMTLEMQLLHEGDLYTVINKLNKLANGLFDIQNCSISMNTSNSLSLIERDSDTNFASVCVLNWYTMQKKSVSLPSRRPGNA